MNWKFALAAIGALGLAGAGGAVAVAATSAAPAAARGDAFWANVHWDQDADDRVVRGPLPLPNANAIRAAGMTEVIEVERDDGLIEVEGFNAQGQKLKVVMDRGGQRVLSVRPDTDD